MVEEVEKVEMVECFFHSALLPCVLSLQLEFLKGRGSQVPEAG